MCVSGIKIRFLMLKIFMFIELKLDVIIVCGFGKDKLDLWIFVFGVEMV